jgi:hypothetical protein
MSPARQMYDGDHVYDLEAALAWRLRAKAEQAQRRRAIEATWLLVLPVRRRVCRR